MWTKLVPDGRWPWPVMPASRGDCMSVRAEASFEASCGHHIITLATQHVFPGCTPYNRSSSCNYWHKIISSNTRLPLLCKTSGLGCRIKQIAFISWWHSSCTSKSASCTRKVSSCTRKSASSHQHSPGKGCLQVRPLWTAEPIARQRHHQTTSQLLMCSSLPLVYLKSHPQNDAWPSLWLLHCCASWCRTISGAAWLHRLEW